MPSEAERLTEALAGRYRIEREIGAGGMATVFLAHDVRHDRDVALKLLRRELAEIMGTERFVREVGIAAALAHPGIVPVLDSGTVELGGLVLPYYVMPFLREESLRDRIARERQLPLDEAIRIARDVAEAIDFAHERGIVHRDVKPANILLAGERAMLADFGIARAVAGAVDRGATLTVSGVAVGTPAYMSPEQAAGDAAVDGRTDVYALAVTLYEMLAGDLPYSGVTPQAILARQISGDVHPLSTVRPVAVNALMDAAIRRALSPAPADRFASAREFVRAFEAGRAAGTRPARRDRRPLARLAVGAGLALVGAGALWQVVGRDAGADSRLGVGVMPFRSMSGAEEFAETIPDLLATFIDGTPGVRVADPWALWRPLRSTRSAPARSPDPLEADELARRAGVRRYVLGTVVRSGDRLDLSLRIYGVGVPEPLQSFSLYGSVDSTAVLAQRTAVGVLERVWDGEGGPSVPRMESVLTQSPDALKAYLAAREAMRRGLPDSANAAITRALALDSMFALALVEATTIRSWVQYLRGQTYSGLRELAERAMTRRDSLPERLRLRLEAQLAMIETQGATAAERWQQLLERDSTDVEAVSGLSGASLLYGWQFGATLPDVIRHSDRDLALDSTDAASLFRRAWLSLSTFDPNDVRRQLARVRADGSNAPMLRTAERSLATLLASDAQYAAMLDSIADAPTYEWASIHRALRAFRPDRGLAMCFRTLDRSAPGAGLALAQSGTVGLLVAAGRLSTVDSLWDAGTFATGGPLFRYAQLIVHTALIGIEDTALTARAVHALTALVPVDSAVAWFDRTPAWLVAFTLGAWHAQRGDTLVALRWLETVPRFRGGGSPSTWRESIVADIEGRLATRRGDTAAAHAAIERAYRLWTVHTGNASPADPEPAMRYRLAESLLTRGMPDSAAHVLSSFVAPFSWLGSYVPVVHSLLAQHAERTGDRGAAARHWDQAVQLWALGDAPVVGARRTAAEAGLRRTQRGALYRYGR